MSKKIARDGGEAEPEVVFDTEKKVNYHLDSTGKRVEHGTPEGFSFDAEGRLHPKKNSGITQVPAPVDAPAPPEVKP
jgi:hypothetical protein